MAKRTLMLEAGDVTRRANTAFERNWRTWAQGQFASEGASETEPRLAVSLHPPREADLRTGEQIARARAWAAWWRDCTLPGVEWETRSWASVGTQSLPVRVSLDGPEQIALWAGRSQLWEKACARMADIRERFCSVASGLGIGTASAAARPSERNERIARAVRASISGWCALDDDDWIIALHVWEWLFTHPGEQLYVRQLPIRGIDTKWIETHGKTLQDLHRALTGNEFAFAKPGKLFRCKACCEEMRLGGCDEFALPAVGLAALRTPPNALVVCENLVNTLCLHDLPGTLAVHGAGFAVAELKAVPWLAEVPLLYWGDLDSHGFAILNLLRSFAPHARSVMMDERTLHRHFDLCVDEPKPATGTFERLTSAEHATLAVLSEGDPARGIANLRLEQERIEWSWAYEQIREASAGV